MKKEKFEKTANYIVLFFSVYAILDILRIYFFLGERGLSFGDSDLNYLSRFFYSFNLPITDIKILIFSNVLIFTILSLGSLFAIFSKKNNSILNWQLYLFIALNSLSILKTLYVIFSNEKLPTEYRYGLIFTLLIYTLFEFIFIYTLKKLNSQLNNEIEINN